MSSEEHGLESDMLFNDAVKRVRTKGWEPGEIVLSLAEKEKEGKLNLPQFVGPKWWEVQYWRPVIWVTETLFSTNWWASIWFRIKNGFWPVEAYNLDYHMAKWLLPRLKYLRKTSSLILKVIPPRNGMWPSTRLFGHLNSTSTRIQSIPANVSGAGSKKGSFCLQRSTNRYGTDRRKYIRTCSCNVL